MNKYEKLEKLKKLLDDEAITQEEYNLEKDKVLRHDIKAESDYWGMDKSTFLMLMHISQYASCFGIGFILPIIMWATNRDKSTEVDRHGKNILNWMLSAFIYTIISTVLCFILIGFIGLLILFFCYLIFPIYAAIKAKDGIEWKYPYSIQFF